MDNKQVPVGYERIGSWNVNLAIPITVRDTLRADFDVFSRGKTPDPEAFTYLSLTKAMIGSPDALSYFEGINTDERANLEHMLRDSSSPENLVSIAKLWIQIGSRQTESSKSYAEHRLASSGIVLPPDAFVEMHSYLTGNLIDAYERTKDAGVIETEQDLYTQSPIDLFIWQVRKGEKVSAAGINYKVKITIDCKTREARIDPAS